MSPKEIMVKNLKVWADLNDESTNWTEVIYTEKNFGRTVDPLAEWCTDHFDDGTWTYYAGIPSYRFHFHFAHPNDATLFRLRWM